MTREEALKILICRSGWNLSICDIKALDMAIEALEQEPQTFEWCHDCSEYNQDKHCCPRYNNVIRNAVEEMKQSCEDAISRESAQEGLTHLMDSDGFRDSVGYVQKSLVRKMLNDLPSVQPKPIECEDAISRAEALKALDYDIKSFEFKSGVGRHMDEIANLLNTIYEIQSDNIKALPPVRPKTKTGHWIHTSGYNFHCSECDFIQHESKTEYKYCPNCGCRLVEPQESEVQE